MIKLLYLTTGKYITWESEYDEEIRQDIEELVRRRQIGTVESFILLILAGSGDTDNYSSEKLVFLNAQKTRQHRLPSTFYDRNNIKLPASFDEFQIVSV